MHVRPRRKRSPEPSTPAAHRAAKSEVPTSRPSVLALGDGWTVLERVSVPGSSTITTTAVGPRGTLVISVLTSQAPVTMVHGKPCSGQSNLEPVLARSMREARAVAEALRGPLDGKPVVHSALVAPGAAEPFSHLDVLLTPPEALAKASLAYPVVWSPTEVDKALSTRGGSPETPYLVHGPLVRPTSAARPSGTRSPHGHHQLLHRNRGGTGRLRNASAQVKLASLVTPHGTRASPPASLQPTARPGTAGSSSSPPRLSRLHPVATWRRRRGCRCHRPPVTSSTSRIVGSGCPNEHVYGNADDPPSQHEHPVPRLQSRGCHCEQCGSGTYTRYHCKTRPANH